MSFCLFLAKMAKISPHRQVSATFTKIFPLLLVLPLLRKISPYSILLSPSPIQPCFLQPSHFHSYPTSFSNLHTFIQPSHFHSTFTLSFLHPHKLPPDCKESGKERREREKEREKERERPPRQSKTGVNGSTKG